MDEDSGPIQTEQTPQPTAPQNEGGSTLGAAQDMGQKLKEGASKAKDVIGAATGGSGDGIGGGAAAALGKGLGALSGGKSGGSSMDGIKTPGGAKTPSMFRGLESDSSPAKKNSLGSEGGDSKNPAAKDASDKVKSVASKAAQGVDDAKTAVDAVRAVSGDATAIAKIAERFAKDPKAAVKQTLRLALYAIMPFILQFIILAVILGGVFFGIYKVYLMGASVLTRPWDIANDLRVSREMGGYLAKAVLQLTYEREQSEHSKPGVAYAASANQKKYDLSGVKLNPEAQKMHDAWDSAGLAEKFMDDYHAKIVPNGTSPRRVDSYNPSAWNLQVNNQDLGPLSGEKALAFISVFTEDTTHWNAIYTRAALKDVSKNKYGTESFKLNLPDSKNDIGSSRENVTKKIVTDTLKPVSADADKHTKCLTTGGADNCDSLGLGSKESPSNDPPANCGGGISGLICNAVAIVQKLQQQSQVSSSNLSNFAKVKGDEVTSESSTYENKASLAANISTGASDAVLQGIDTTNGDPATPGAPNSKVLLQMYDQFQKATNNQNFSRVNYDRTSKQSVAEAQNYFTAGGQLLNNEIGLLDSWALTENLSQPENSQTFRAAVLGSPTGLYAQGSATQERTCQKVYDDEAPVQSIKDSSVDRNVKSSSCFTQSLVPNLTEFKNEKTLNKIYDQLEANSNKSKSSGGFLSSLINIFNAKVAALQKNEVRKSPVATTSVDLDPSLSPDFDAYTNQVYGVSKTGAEVDGEAYDTLKIAAESMWSSAAISPNTSMGGKYQDNAAVAKTMQYAARFERQKFAFKPLSERMAAIKNPDSLAGKLALLAPTSARSGISKTLALMSPTNLTSAVASRMTPTTFAQSATTAANVNPVGAVRIGYSSGDPSNFMDSQQLWDTYKCGGGEAAQTTAQPNGIPFTLPSSSNPCKRETVLSIVSTCYLDDGDTCKLGDGSATNSDGGGANPGDIGADTTNIPCYPGTNLVGIHDDAYSKGTRIRINLCEVPNIPCNNEECTQFGHGHALASSIASEAWFKLAEKARSAGIPLSATSSWRSMAHQQRLCSANALCASGKYTAVARPGTSNHQAGVAMDIAEAGMGKGAASGRSCSNPQTVPTATYSFLEQYARSFGIKHYANESWHWGTAEKC